MHYYPFHWESYKPNLLFSRIHGTVYKVNKNFYSTYGFFMTTVIFLHYLSLLCPIRVQVMWGHFCNIHQKYITLYQYIKKYNGLKSQKVTYTNRLKVAQAEKLTNQWLLVKLARINALSQSYVLIIYCRIYRHFEILLHYQM